jgi:hypothetical protein
MEIIMIFTALLLGVCIWMSFIAVYAVIRDEILEAFQKTSQIVIVLVIPLLGALFVLYLINQHSPEAIPKSLIPWPFRSILFGKAPPRNKNRNNDEESGIDLFLSRRQDRRREIEEIIDGD